MQLTTTRFSCLTVKMALPTFAYTYEEAVNHKPPFLSEFRGNETHNEVSTRRHSPKRTISFEDDQQKLIAGRQRTQLKKSTYEGTDIEKSSNQQRHKRLDSS
jgi:type I restriction enzyme R subunit